jgi:hypothetical protein
MIVTCLIVATVAVTRLTRLLVTDKLMVGYRQFIVRKWGKDSLAAYWAHCPWCTSMWVALFVMPPAVFWPNQWVLAALSVPAASMVAGLLLDKE